MRSFRIVLIGLSVLLAACAGTPEPTPPGPEVTPSEIESADETIIPSEPSPSDPGTTAAACGGREPGSQTDEAVLVVDSPAADAEFASGATVSGCTNAFEAAFQWELLGADGQVLASGNETATCGSGCLGTFEFAVDYEVDDAQEGVLRLFVESAEDGSVQMENEMTVHLQP